VVQSLFVIIYENAGGNVHSIDQAKAFPEATFSDGFLNFVSDVYQLLSLFRLKPEVLGPAFHLLSLLKHNLLSVQK